MLERNLPVGGVPVSIETRYTKTQAIERSICRPGISQRMDCGVELIQPVRVDPRPSGQDMEAHDIAIDVGIEAADDYLNAAAAAESAE